MSLPVRQTAAELEIADVELVKVRIMGQAEAVAQVARELRHVLHVAEESADYPRRRDLGVRRYLTVVFAPGAAIPPPRGGRE